MSAVSSKTPGVYRIDFFGPGIVAAFSGTEFDRARHGDFLRVLGIDAKALKRVHQAHTAVIHTVTADGTLPDADADGLISSRPGDYLGILTADCLPVFYHDPVGGNVALAHAGWRGLSQGILAAMAERLSGGDPERARRLRVFIGPCIRACCYEVGEELAPHFEGHYKPSDSKAGKGHLDLTAAASRQLLAAGIEFEALGDCGICTACRKEAFFSVRGRPATEERILSVIGRKA